MKSKFSLVIILLISIGSFLWISYKQKSITQNAEKENSGRFANSSQNFGTEAGAQNTMESNTADQFMNAKSADEQNYIDNAKLIKIAYEQAKQGAEIPDGLMPKITYRGVVAEIVWPIESSPDTIFPRGDYHALVEINRKSGAIIKVLASP